MTRPASDRPCEKQGEPVTTPLDGIPAEVRRENWGCEVTAEVGGTVYQCREHRDGMHVFAAHWP